MLIFFLFIFISLTCSEKIKGVNLGSYFVLEPYINPSLFYQFIGVNTEVVGDSFTFCEYLGPKEANRQLLQHWKTWVTFEKLAKLKNVGINTIRIPVGDWMFIPYQVYDKQEDNIRCFDQSINYLDKLMKYCHSLSLKVIIDVHGVKDSQNGYDNSGHAMDFQVFKKKNILHFNHWSFRKADWVGDFNLTSKKYNHIHYGNIDHLINVNQFILQKYMKNPSFWGLEPINEPWEFTPLLLLKHFYKKVYDTMINEKEYNQKVLILHDSFRPMNWTDAYFLEKNGKPKIKIYLDTHQYMAWGIPIPFTQYLTGAHLWKQPKSVFEILVGEFSLATDNCMMWLNGFMDNYPGFPLQDCFYEDCPFKDEHLEEIENVLNGPFGSGISKPLINGQCPTTIPIYLNQNISHNKKLNDDVDQEKLYVRYLFNSLTKGYENNSAGWIFWNFDIESSSYQWSFLKLIDKNYIKIPEDKEKYNIENTNLFIIMTSIIVFLFFMILLINRCHNKISPRQVAYNPIPLMRRYSLLRANESYGTMNV